jgi:hypothetical protein
MAGASQPATAATEVAREACLPYNQAPMPGVVGLFRKTGEESNG